jgi:hypothetical protein
MSVAFTTRRRIQGALKKPREIWATHLPTLDAALDRFAFTRQ